MRVKTGRLSMKKAADKIKTKKWSNENGFIGNNSRVINIADLGNESYLGMNFYKIIQVPGNEFLQIYDL